jgi:hypothetical protein
MRLEIIHRFVPDDEVLDRLESLSQKMDLIIENQETTMIDVTALQAVATRLQASDTAALAALQALKDQNTSLAAHLAAIPTQDPATQTAINDVVTALTGTADAVDKAVTANPDTPNLTPSPSA